MKAQLQEKEWTFNFGIQRNRSNMSVEDNMTDWAIDFEPAATITIPRQEFATLERYQFCESLSFTPWHGLPQHRPLGAVNRMRRVVYEAISKKRRKCCVRRRMAAKAMLAGSGVAMSHGT